MAEYTALAPLFTDIANAIRSKTGETGTITANNFPEEIASISKSSGGFSIGQILQLYTTFGHIKCPLNEKTLIRTLTSAPILGGLFQIGVSNFNYDNGERVKNYNGSVELFLAANSSFSLQGYIFSLENKELYIINKGLKDFYTDQTNSKIPYWI